MASLRARVAALEAQVNILRAQDENINESILAVERFYDDKFDAAAEMFEKLRKESHALGMNPGPNIIYATTGFIEYYQVVSADGTIILERLSKLDAVWEASKLFNESAGRYHYVVLERVRLGEKVEGHNG